MNYELRWMQLIRSYSNASNCILIGLTSCSKKRKVKDMEQRCRLLAHQHLYIKKLFMVRSYANVEEKLVVVKEVDKVLGELGKTPFEPLKEKQEEGMIFNVVLKKCVTILNGYFTKNFKGAPSSVGTSSP
jgi:hypothetical protein